MNKDFKDWTFDDLVTHATWMVIEAITHGRQLKNEIFQVCNMVIRWNEVQKREKK